METSRAGNTFDTVFKVSNQDSHLCGGSHHLSTAES